MENKPVIKLKALCMIRYTIKEMINPQNRAISRYYAKPVHGRTVKQAQIEAAITQRASLSRGDIRSVIDCLVDVIADNLDEGSSTKIEELGTFFIRTKSRGKETPNEVTRNDFISLSVGFKPAPELRERLRNIQFRKASKVR